MICFSDLKAFKKLSFVVELCIVFFFVNVMEVFCLVGDDVVVLVEIIRFDE